MNPLANLTRIAVVSLAFATTHALAMDEQAKRKGGDRESDPVYREIRATLHGSDLRSKSALAKLSYIEQWRRHQRGPTRKAVKTSDNKDAEIVLLEAPDMSMPGYDFTMAFLMVNHRVVDWASCWTYNRIATQKLLLEDVDGDGLLDVAFRAENGFWGLQDERQNRRPGDSRVWLGAYSISSKGLKAIFPVKDRIHHLKPWFHSGKLPLVF